MNKNWSEQSKLMQSQLKKKDTFESGIDTLITLRKDLMTQIQQFKKELLLEDFSVMPFINAKGYHCKSIAYSLWHIFRIEDIVAHSLIAGDEQIFPRGDYQKRINAPIITTSNEMIKEVVPLGYAGNPPGYDLVGKHVKEMVALQVTDIAKRILENKV